MLLYLKQGTQGIRFRGFGADATEGTDPAFSLVRSLERPDHPGKAPEGIQTVLNPKP